MSKSWLLSLRRDIDGKKELTPVTERKSDKGISS